ncbi:MAG: sigma-70 family RNA polymerase sigma factor [Nocardiopsaceae bacterium]|jgi:RNA polymerase sigma-70 factor (ECF subfamily)|nr:sigma-70 family RNA polymerase sigma factor [Nocardiopsaceae bacterium]
MDPTVAAAVAEAHREGWGFVLAATARITRDLDTAEDCVQDAYAQALQTWSESGVPAKTTAWLTVVARRRAMNIIRRQDTLARKLPMLISEEAEVWPQDSVDDAADQIPDDRLRLIFTCCHPTLAVEARVALTLRLLCGLTTGEVASAFLVSEPTMAARITRAKKKISAARIPYQVPPAGELQDRLNAVLDVVHLLFTTGHTAPAGESLQRRDLTERALDLARMLRHLLPEDPAVAGLLALILLTDARRLTRTAPDGGLLLISEQDRSRWDRPEIDEGLALIGAALERRPPTRYALMAAIAAVHAEAQRWEATDWQRMVGLYDTLIQIWPSPVVGLNRAVAVGEANGPREGLAALDQLSAEPQLVGYHYLPAARAEFLRRLHRNDEARLAYREAQMLADNRIEREFLDRRLTELDLSGGRSGHEMQAGD